MSDEPAHVELALPAWLEAELVDERTARSRLAPLINQPWNARVGSTPFGEVSDNLADRLLIDVAGAEAVEQRMEAYGSNYDRGSMRQVIIGPCTVIKLPIDLYNDAGDACDSQLHEAAASQLGYPITPAGQLIHVPVAAIRLVWHTSGLPIIIMERIVRRADAYGDDQIGPMPKWAVCVDGMQVGYSRSHAQWVVFDAGGVPGHPAFQHLEFERVAA